MKVALGAPVCVQYRGARLLLLCCRFGKVLWGKLPEDVTSNRRGWGIETLADLLFADTDRALIFTTE